MAVVVGVVTGDHGGCHCIGGGGGQYCRWWSVSVGVRAVVVVV